MPDPPLIYLDNNATTRVHPEVFEAMTPLLTGDYGNPSAGYRFAKRTRAMVEHARAQVAALINAQLEEIVFTGCGTESINTAIHSAIATQPARKHLITSTVEHSAVSKYLESLEEPANGGYEVTRIGVNEGGIVDLDALKAAIRPGETALISIIWANNETGVISPIGEIADIAHEAGVPLHLDAVQAVGKVPVDAETLQPQFLSISGHKLHAPKGVGALYVNRNIRFQPLLIGGGQEADRRSGTENVAGIVGLGKAAEIMKARLEAGDFEKLRALRDRFEQRVLAEVPGSAVNGDPEHRLPNTSNLYFEGVDAEGLLILLDNAGVCCSPGSACSTGAVHPSPVLKAMGFSSGRARSSVRFSMSLFTTEEEVNAAADAVRDAAAKLRIVSPPEGSRVVRHT